MSDLIKIIGEQWELITAAPLAIITLILVIVGVSFVIFNFIYQGRLDTLRGQLDLAKDRNDDYASKLKVASPDEAKREVDDLRNTVADLNRKIEELSYLPDQANALADLTRQFENQRPKKIPENVILEMIEILNPFAGTGLEILAEMSSESAKFISKQLELVFYRSGWNVDCGIVVGVSNPPEHGVRVMLSDDAVKIGLDAAIKMSLEKAGFKIDILRGVVNKAHGKTGIVVDIELTSPAE